MTWKSLTFWYYFFSFSTNINSLWYVSIHTLSQILSASLETKGSTESIFSRVQLIHPCLSVCFSLPGKSRVPCVWRGFFSCSGFFSQNWVTGGEIGLFFVGSVLEARYHRIGRCWCWKVKRGENKIRYKTRFTIYCPRRWIQCRQL